MPHVYDTKLDRAGDSSVGELLATQTGTTVGLLGQELHHDNKDSANASG